MLSLRRERVEKQNSRGEIVRKEQVTVTKKPEWPPSKAVLLSNPYKKFPPQETKFLEHMGMGRKSRQGRQLDYINEKDLGHLISELLKRQQGGFSKANVKNFDNEISNTEDSDVEDVESSDAEYTNSEEFEADDTNSEEFEADDTNSEKSEDGDANSEESQVESSNYEESEVDEAEDEDISSDESQVESSNFEESEADEVEDEDIGSEESEAQDINSEELSEVKDSDDEPPRPLIDINRSERNLPTGRIFTDIDQCIHNSLLKRHLMDFNPKRSNLFDGRAETRISRLIDYTPPERLSWIELKHK